MSQRGGSVTGDVRFGDTVFSPDGAGRRSGFPAGARSRPRWSPHRHMLRPERRLDHPDAVRADQLPNKKTLNVALLGALSAHLPMTEDQWLESPARWLCGDIL